uniref:Uncharacterized protein n=1 Tax=Leersia perrieri TaxID=77586 RepID=A0A0D9V4S1_9ORYZ
MPSSPPPPPPPIGDGDGGGGGGGEARSCGSPSPTPTPSVLRRMRKGSPNRSGGSARKSLGSRGFRNSILNSPNMSTSQFKKRVSPIRWSPRKKTESYLKRKIKRLQESDGMIQSLHETLGNANPHYTRMAREKIAARKAATKAMEAHKSAMVEASWCRILHAARIQNKDAEENMEKAKLRAADAFQEAREIGVMMYDRPDCSNQQYEVESSSHTGGQSTHKVIASFQTGFEVDMEVAAAVKKAFMQLANSSDSSKKEEFKELLWKISQNPDATEIDANSEDEHQEDCNNEDKRNLKFNNVLHDNTNVQQPLRVGIFPSDLDNTIVQQPYDLVSIILERLKALHEDELASLAVIVATSGLNAALQSDRGKYQETESVNNISAASKRSHSRRYSTAASFVDILEPRKEITSELPSLDKFLVKHLSKLEKEVEEARKASRKASSGNSCAQGAQSQTTGRNLKSQDSASDLGNILVKRVSKLEKEILEAKKNSHIQLLEKSCKNVELHVKEDANKEESEFYKAQTESCNSNSMGGFDSKASYEKSKNDQDCSQDKENKIVFSHQLPPSGAKGKQAGKRLTRIEAAKLEALKSFCTKDGNTFDVGLDKIFVKPVHRLEREKKKALEYGQTNVQKDPQKNDDNTTVTGSLDEILVKHVSRLEREKIDYEKRNSLGKGLTNVPHDRRKYGNNATGSLDEILVKHVSRLEREKIDYEKRNALGEGLTNVPHDQRKHGNNATGSLDEILVKHVSRLEREKIDYENRNALGGGPINVPHDQILAKHVPRLEKEKMEHEKSGDMILRSDSKCIDGEAGLADILVKRPMKVERAKIAASAAEEALESSFNPVEERRRAKEKELMDAWGGVGLENAMKLHVSKIERHKIEWRKAEEEQKQLCAPATREL